MMRALALAAALMLAATADAADGYRLLTTLDLGFYNLNNESSYNAPTGFGFYAGGLASGCCSFEFGGVGHTHFATDDGHPFWDRLNSELHGDGGLIFEVAPSDGDDNIGIATADFWSYLDYEPVLDWPNWITGGYARTTPSYYPPNGVSLAGTGIVVTAYEFTLHRFDTFFVSYGDPDDPSFGYDRYEVEGTWRFYATAPEPSALALVLFGLWCACAHCLRCHG